MIFFICVFDLTNVFVSREGTIKTFIVRRADLVHSYRIILDNGTESKELLPNARRQTIIYHIETSEHSS